MKENQCWHGLDAIYIKNFRFSWYFSGIVSPAPKAHYEVSGRPVEISPDGAPTPPDMRFSASGG